MSTVTAPLDALLASAADEGLDQDRYALIVQHSSDRLMALARRMLRAYPHLQRWEETDDVFQEAAVRLCRSMREIKPRSKEQLFALAILQTRRALIDLARHHFGPLGEAGHYRSDPALELDGCSGLRSADARDRSNEPQTLAEWAEFHEAVGQLPATQREVFELIWYGGVTYTEAAALLGITRRTVVRRMNSARLHLAPVVAERSRR